MRTLIDLTWHELFILRLAPYESPLALEGLDRVDRAVVDSLIMQGLLSIRDDDSEVRVTEQGDEQAMPLTLAEVDTARENVWSGMEREQAPAISVLLRFAAEVAIEEHERRTTTPRNGRPRASVEHLAQRLSGAPAMPVKKDRKKVGV